MRDIIKEIQDKLLEIEERENISILLAVESGSRAWGFASPDSDYDVRFIYVGRQKDYLKLNAPKDVIEWQLDEVFDINGWDLKKALLQFRRSNTALFEWSNSPIVYKKTPLWEEIYNKAKIYFAEKAAIYQYYGMAKSTFEGYLREERVKYKKYFYALRPLLACRYIEHHHEIPPVLFDELYHEKRTDGHDGMPQRVLNMELPKELYDSIRELLEVKKNTDEKELSPHMPVIIEFIRSELERQKQIVDTMEDDRRTEWETLNEIFLDVLSK